MEVTSAKRLPAAILWSPRMHLPRGTPPISARSPGGRVVVDEAQAIKNAATKQATAIRSIPAGTRIAVTGTPVENRLADLWSILEFANPGLLGSAAAFKKRYAEPIERVAVMTTPRIDATLHRAVHPAPRQDRHVDHR